MTTRIARHLVVSIVALPLQLAAQTAEDVRKINVEAIAGRLDFSIPTSPAFTMLGVSPEKVTQSDDFRVIALGLLRGLDARGNLQSGVAIDTRPYLVAFGQDATLAAYQASVARRVLSNAQLSFATTSGKDDADRADRTAVGLRLTLWREVDPALGNAALEYVPVTRPNQADRPVLNGKTVKTTIGDCYADYLLSAATAPDVLPESDAELTKTEAEIAAKARKTVEKCLTPFKTRYWNAGSLDVGIAGSRVKVNGASENGTAAWVGYSHSLQSFGQVVFRASYTEDRLDPVKGSIGAFQLVDETDVGGRVRVGSKRGTFMIEALWAEAETAASGKDRYWRGSVGAEFEIYRDIWIQLAVGKAFSTTVFDDDPLYSGQLRVGFSEQSLFRAAQ